MPKLKCPCGFVHNLSPIPDDGWITVRDHDYESVTEAERTTHEIAGTSLPSQDHPRSADYDTAMATIANATGLLYDCSECGTIMWRKPGCDRFEAYSPMADDGG